MLVVGLVMVFLYSHGLFLFLLGLESISSVKGQRMTILVVNNDGLYAFGKICASQGCWIRLVLQMMFYIVVRFCNLYFGIVISTHKFFRLVLCRFLYFNKI